MLYPCMTPGGGDELILLELFTSCRKCLTEAAQILYPGETETAEMKVAAYMMDGEDQEGKEERLEGNPCK